MLDGYQQRVVLAHASPFSLGPARFDPPHRLVTNGRESLVVEPRVMQLFVALARADGAVLSRDDLIEQCWGGRIVGENAIQRAVSHARNLARRLGEDAFEIETIKGVGYRLRIGDPGSIEAPGTVTDTGAPRFTRRSAVAAGGATAVAAGGAYALFVAPNDHPSPLARRFPDPIRRWSPALIAGLAAIVLIALSLFWWRPWPAPNAGPSVTVVANDESTEARELAENLLVQLGSLQAANADALQLVEPESRAKAGLTFKVGADGGPGDPRAYVSLIDDRAGTLLWSREFVQPDGNQADLRQQIAYSAAQVLQCTTDALSPAHPKIGLPTLKLYLSGCADLSNLLARDPRSVIPTFEKVIEQAPKFAGGWAKLLLAHIHPARFGAWSDDSSVRELQAQIVKARKLHPNLTEAYLAESWIQPPRPIIGWMRFIDEAVEKDPNHPEALEMHSLGMLRVGRLREAVNDARRAVQSNPLSPSVRDMLNYALLSAGQIEAARSELREAERLWPGTTNVIGTRYRFEYRYGDAAEALRMLRSGQAGITPSAAEQSYLVARFSPSPANIDRAVADARSRFKDNGDLYRYAFTLADFGRTEELANALLTADPKLSPGVVLVLFQSQFKGLHHDPRFMEIAKRFELTPYWRETGRWPDFCFEPDLPYDCKEAAANVAK